MAYQGECAEVICVNILPQYSRVLSKSRRTSTNQRKHPWNRGTVVAKCIGLTVLALLAHHNRSAQDAPYVAQPPQ